MALSHNFSILGKISVVKRNNSRQPHEGGMYWSGSLVSTHHFCFTVSRNKRRHHLIVPLPHSFPPFSLKNFRRKASKNLSSDKCYADNPGHVQTVVLIKQTSSRTKNTLETPAQFYPQSKLAFGSLHFFQDIIASQNLLPGCISSKQQRSSRRKYCLWKFFPG